MSSLERVVTKKRANQSDEPWRYWLTRPASERIAAAEELRREHHGWKHGTEPGLQEFLQSFVERDVRFLVAGREPQRIAILTFATGLSFEHAYADRMTIEIGGRPVPFVSVDDLRTNKLATGRLRDRADAAELAGFDNADP